MSDRQQGTPGGVGGSYPQAVTTGDADYRYEYDFWPYVYVVTATFPADRWSAVFFSWLSVKGFTAGMHYVEGAHCYATPVEGDRVWATFAIRFSNEEAVSSWYEYGYPVEEMLAGLGVAAEDITSIVARDFG
jgi:hypothetical protein